MPFKSVQYSISLIIHFSFCFKLTLVRFLLYCSTKVRLLFVTNDLSALLNPMADPWQLGTADHSLLPETLSSFGFQVFTHFRFSFWLSGSSFPASGSYLLISPWSVNIGELQCKGLAPLLYPSTLALCVTSFSLFFKKKICILMIPNLCLYSELLSWTPNSYIPISSWLSIWIANKYLKPNMSPALLFQRCFISVMEIPFFQLPRLNTWNQWTFLFC